MGMIAGVVLTLALFAFIFWPERNPFKQADKTRVDYLRERKDTIYENLRDLNFEYLAGKYPEQDYAEQRAGLEDEAARVIAEMELLGARGVFGRRASLTASLGFDVDFKGDFSSFFSPTCCCGCRGVCGVFRLCAG